MKAATEIKFTAGDLVYWLSSDGFKKGIIKSVTLIDEMSTYKDNKGKKRKEVIYRLWHEGQSEVYMGDQVAEDKIFTSYKDMLEAYSKVKL